jgi:E3 ubiquitin-protein ligase DOA10
MLDPQKRTRSRVERDLILQQLESETSKKKIAELKKCLSPVRYQQPGRVEVYLSVINFIAYELIAAVLWNVFLRFMKWN